MGRTPGTRNADYDAERERLVERLKAALVEAGGAARSFRELAAAASVSPPTLRHYFGTREGVIAAVFAALHRDGLPYLHVVAAGPLGPVRESLRGLLDFTVEGWERGVGAIHQLGLTAGLGDGVLGPAYVNELLEPTLQAFEARIARHVADGSLGPCDVRHAAVALLSPVLVALLHQQSLGGARCRPLDLGELLDDHVDRFLRAHAPEPAPPPAARAGRRPRRA